jgi:hypothetical protein
VARVSQTTSVSKKGDRVALQGINPRRFQPIDRVTLEDLVPPMPEVDRVSVHRADQHVLIPFGREGSRSTRGVSRDTAGQVSAYSSTMLGVTPVASWGRTSNLSVSAVVRDPKDQGRRPHTSPSPNVHRQNLGTHTGRTRRSKKTMVCQLVPRGCTSSLTGTTRTQASWP